MDRVYNFSAGPSALPGPVLERAQAELLDWQGSGMSVMEVSHRGPNFMEYAERAEAMLRELLAVPDEYRALFLAGGATLQFASIPLNLSVPGSTADYVVTGNWGKKAASEAARYLNVNIAADSAASGYTTIPDLGTWSVSDEAAYLHYTPNETVFGVEFHGIPDVSDAPLVADMSSTLLTRPIDVSRYGVIYAGAQKNLGAAGITLLIVREDLIGRARRETPGVIDYKLMADANSMWNTPPTFCWYILGLVLEWLRAQGGLTAVAERNRGKASKLYAAIDASDFYDNVVDPACRSWVNVPFKLATSELDQAFLDEAEAARLTNLKGHRLAGGMRASLYNAMPESGVDALIDFMADFEARRA
ncbi:3-phosphoserine/phosphohydroxythreonine transaminase [Candidatus Rariloculus sp.]|uniref:3-phosphoserine/phosphohydroxythreonine transaminase n=1 Tax=Candidatus Rariloculus sp. TaxID=3101265 RepID=UPI003D0FEF3A